MIPEDGFAPPTIQKTIYLKFEWSCGADDWYFLEDDQKDHLKGTVGFAHQLEPKLDETDWSLIRNWVNECLQRHQSDCISPDQIDLPGFEVIDCKTRKLVPGNKGAEFAALSYVWGSQSQGVLPNRTNLPNPFPEKVIEDALACTTKLKIPYLWVDRYCIDQNDTSDTKQHLIQNMDKVYSAAKVTIINVAGDDASTGIPGVSTTLRVPSASRAFIYGRKYVRVINPKKSIITSKWATRGWTLQESLLAHRRLVFTDTQVYFQCTQNHCIESVRGAFCSSWYLEAERFRLLNTLQRPQLATQAFPSSIIGSHRQSSYSMIAVCDEFARRDLTTDEDALRACMGIFSRLWASEKPSYQYWGLPFQGNSDTAFAISLLWGFDKAHDAVGYPPRARRSLVPSWSWLAWKGYMGFTCADWDDDRDEIQSRVGIKVPVQREKQDIMSTIDDYIKDIDGGGLFQNWLPYLKLSGWVATMRFESYYGSLNNHFDGRVSCYLASGQHEIGSGEILPTMWAEGFDNDEAVNPSMLLRVIFIAYKGDRHWYCLVIRQIGKEEAGKYERLGMCRMRCDSPEVTEAQNTNYMVVRDFRFGVERHLECKFATISLM